MNDRRTHILVECPERIASAQVGVIAPLLPEDGKLYDVQFVCTREIKKKHLVWADIFVTVRGCEPLTLHIVREAKKLNRFIVYYLDDDLLNLPKDSLSYAYFSDGEHAEVLRQTLGCSDVLWGVNQRIREKYLPLCPSGRWIWNRVPMTAVPSALASDEFPVRILYAGSVDHVRMIKEILVPAVRRVCAECGDKVQFTFVGTDPGINDCPQVTFQRFFKDYGEYRRFVENGNFSIAMAVVRMDDFYQCKYYNKYVEYSSIGAAGIYTDCDLYRQVVKNGENGILCENTTEGWTAAIERLVDDPALRRTCMENAQEHLRAEFQPADVCEHMKAQLPELVAYRAPRITKRQLRLSAPLVYFYMDRARFLLRRYKVLGIPIIAFKAVKILIKAAGKVLHNVFSRILQRN